MYRYRVAVNNQLCYKYSSSDRLVSDGINFTNIVFMFYEGWDGLDCVAQFRQGEECYSVALVNNECKLPNELVAGNVSISVFGYKAGEAVRGTTVSLNDQIYGSGFNGNADPVPPTPDLYSQLLAQIKQTETDTSGYAESAKQSADEAKTSKEEAAGSAKDSEEYATKSAESAEEAEKAKDETVAELGKVQKAGADALSGIGSAKQSALTDISSAKDNAVSAVTGAGTTQTGKVENAGTEALKALDAAKTSAVSAVGTAGTQAKQDIGLAKETALTAISDAQGQATQAIQQAGTNEVGKVNTAGQAQKTAIQQAGETANKQVQQTGTEQADKVTQAGDAKLAEINAANALLPTPTEADAGKAPIAQPDGTYALQEVTVDAYTKAESDARYAPIEAAIKVSGKGTGLASLYPTVPWKLQGLKLYGRSWQDGTPSVENPVPIQSAGQSGQVDVMVAGANLLNPDAASVGVWLNSSTGQTEGSGPCWTSDFIPVFKRRAVYRRNTGLGRAWLYDTNKNPLAYSPFTDSIVPREDGFVRICGYNDQSPPSESWVSYALLPCYEPYTGQQLPILTPDGLPGIPVDSGGNWTDEAGQQWISDVVDLVAGTKAQNVQTLVLDGSPDEMWTKSGNEKLDEFVLTVAEKYINFSGMLCDKFIFAPLYGTGKVWLANDSNRIGFGWKSHTDDTVTDWINFLTQNPVTIMYPLATPITTPLDDATITAYKALQSYPGTTNVLAPDAGIEASALAEPNQWVQQQIQAATTQAVSQAVTLTGGAQ